MKNQKEKRTRPDTLSLSVSLSLLILTLPPQHVLSSILRLSLSHGKSNHLSVDLTFYVSPNNMPSHLATVLDD